MEEEKTVKHFCSFGDVISAELSVNMHLGYFQVCYLFHFLGQGDGADKRENNCSSINCFIYYYIYKKILSPSPFVNRIVVTLRHLKMNQEIGR